MAYLNKKVVHNQKNGKVTLYQLSGQSVNDKSYKSDNWYASIKPPRNPRTQKPEPAKRFSTNLSDFDDAYEYAMSKLWDISNRQKHDLPLSSTKVTKVCDRFILILESEGRFLEDQSNGHYTKLSVSKKVLTVRRFIQPYFGEFNIEDVTDREIKEFKNYRMQNVGGVTHKETITTGTLNKTLTVLRQVFKFAIECELIESHRVPVITNKVRSKDEIARNPDFSPREYKKLVSTASWSVRKENHPRVKNQKYLLYHLILILANTGARMSEIRNLRWSDVVIYTENVMVIPAGGTEKDAYLKPVEFIKIQFYGKVSRSTQKSWCSPVQKVRVYFDRLKEEQKRWAKENQWNWHEGVKVFTNHHGTEVVNFNKGFNVLLKRTDLIEKQIGETDSGEPILKKRNLGGLRHLYAKRMLRQGWDYFLLAKNMRSSPQMLNQFYANEIDVEKIPVQILRMRQQRNPILEGQLY